MSISFSNLKYSLSLHCPWTESLSIVTPSSKLTSLMRIKWSAMDGILMRSWVLVWRSFPWGFSRGRLIGGGSNTPIPDLPWTSHLKPYLLHLQLHMWSDFPLLFQLQNFVPLVLGLFLFLFFGENVELFDFMGFLCVCFPIKFLGLWVAGDWVGYCVYGFVSRVYLWFGFLDSFFVFLVMEIGFGYWIWIWGLLEIGLVASWTWEEHEEYFLLVFNLIFFLFICVLLIWVWVLGSWVCVIMIWVLGSWVRVLVMGLSSWLLGLVFEEHEEQAK